jgi:hypothetical protein
MTNQTAPQIDTGERQQATAVVPVSSIQTFTKAVHGPSIPLPQIVREDHDLVAVLRSHRVRLGLAQFSLDIDAGLQDGYASKLEGPGRNYGRRPTKLTKPVSVTFERSSGQMVSLGNVKTEKHKGAFPVITAQANWYLQAMGLAVVVMDRHEAEAICKRPIPLQVTTPRARTGTRVRRLAIDMTVSDVGIEPKAVPDVDPAIIKEAATLLIRAQKSGKVALIAAAIRFARDNYIDPEALKMAVSMDPDGGIKLANRLARMAVYLDALKNPSVSVSMVDSMDHVIDRADTEIARHQEDSALWSELFATSVKPGRV